VVGTPAAGHASLTAFQHGWEVIAAIGLLAAVVGIVALRPRAAAGQGAGSPVGPVAVTAD
jgi:hypothetical protein